MVLRKITTDNSVRFIPKSEKTKESDNKQKNKRWFNSSKTKQKTITKQ